VKSTVTLLRNQPLQKSERTKDNITKDTITKDKAMMKIEFPDWLPRETFLNILK